ncbi:MAG: glycosyltransferase [Pseudomonadota bacterium]
MAQHSDLAAIQPIPYFPGVSPLPEWGRTAGRDQAGLRIRHAPMFYVPKFLKSLDGMWLGRAVRRQLAELKQGGQLDIVDAHFGYPEGIGAMATARRLGVPCVVTLRGFEAEYLRKPIIGAQIRRLLQNVDGCICVGHFLRGLAIDHGANPETTRVIHNAIDRNMFYPADARAVRQQLGLDPSAPIVVSVGHLIPRKRHHVLAAAFAKVLKHHPATKLLIIGGEEFDRSYTRQMKEQISAAGIGESVDLLGKVDARQIASYLQAADVFALGTQREGCCNAVLESLACGLPVVTTPVGDNGWFVKDGENGYLVPVDDSEAMAAALRKVLDKRPWDRQQISAGLAVGDWDAVARDVLAFFDTILTAPHN